MFAKRTNWPLEPNSLARALDAHRRSGKSLIDLTASNPTTCGFVYPEREILDVLRNPRALEYHPESKGLLSARAAVAEYYRDRPCFGDSAARTAASESVDQIDPERIVLTSGTSEAYTHVFRLLCEAGDEILVPAPSYPLLEFLADLADVRLVPYPLLYDHGWQMDLVGLRAALTPRSRAVVVVHPNNPTGSFVKPREAAELAEICAAREMAIVADEVFLDYGDPGVRRGTAIPGTAHKGFVGAEPARRGELVSARVHTIETQPTFAFSDAALTFTLSGLSKISALPQMKLAWIVTSGPESAARAAVERLEVIADTYLSPSTPIQLAASKFLALRGAMQSQLQERIAANLAFLDAAFFGCDAATRLEREGGWYAILRVPKSGSDESLVVSLLERSSVLVHPGTFYNFPSDGFLVLSLIARRTEFEQGASLLKEFLTGL
jgi:aspartate/methionine/tyrosine aminotransferase